jgi:hypothetical protein
MKGWMDRHKVWTGILIVLAALVVIGVFSSNNDKSGGSASSSSESAAVAASGETDSGPVVTGKVKGRFDRDCLVCDGTLAKYVETSDVWCGWRDEKVIVHVVMRNDSVEHVTVDWHPSYVIEGGAEHGAGLTAVQSNGFDAGERRVLEAEQDPQGVAAYASIATCKPSFSVIESG